MTIEIHQPELEALIRQHMASGAFRNVDDLLAKALVTLGEPVLAGPRDSEVQNFVDLSEPVRGLLSDEEVDTLFRRTLSVSRPLDLA